MSANPSGGERSTMARNPPRPGGAPPRPGASRPTAAGGRPRPTASERPKGRVPKGGASWSPPGKGSQPTPPVPKPEADTSAPEPKNLRMVPLSGEGDDPELGSGAPPGATEFFALPTPRRQVDDDEEVVDIRRSDPVATAGSPAAAPPGPAGPPPGANPHGGHASMGGPPMPMAVPMGISGPVASGPMPAGYPAGAPPMMPPDPNADLDRAKSYRVFAVVAGLMFMVFTALVASLVVLAYGFYMMEQAEPVAQNPVVQPVPPPRGAQGMDTGLATPPPPPPPKPSPKPRPKPSSGPKPAPKPAPPPPPAPVAKGPVTISIPSSEPYTSAEIKCDSGVRERGSFMGGKATVQNIPGPGQDNCTLLFKGGGALPKAKVSGGNSYTCTFDGSLANCK